MRKPVVFLILLLSCLATVHADTTKRKFKVGIEDVDYYPHFAFGHQDTSFAQEVLNRFFASHNYEVEYILLPVKRFNEWMQSKNVDFKYPDNPVWRLGDEERVNVRYSRGVISSHAGSVVTIEKLGMNKQQVKIVGTLAGFYPYLWQNQIQVGETKLVEENTPFSLVKLPLNGLVDVIDIDYSVIQHNLNKIGRSGQLVMDPNLPNRSVSYHLSTLHHPSVIKEFNQFLIDNKEFIAAVKMKFNIIDDPIAHSKNLLKASGVDN